MQNAFKLSVRKASRGFTLIELMIVVSIVGILAVLAIYGVRKYLANAKTAEARNGLGQMGKDQSAEYEMESMPGTRPRGRQRLGGQLAPALCLTPSVGRSGTNMTLVQGKKYQSDSATGADWQIDGATARHGLRLPQVLDGCAPVLRSTTSPPRHGGVMRTWHAVRRRAT